MRSCDGFIFALVLTGALVIVSFAFVGLFLNITYETLVKIMEAL